MGGVSVSVCGVGAVEGREGGKAVVLMLLLKGLAGRLLFCMFN